MNYSENQIVEAGLSARTTCEILSCSRQTLWRLDKNGDLRARRLRGRLTYLRSEVMKFLHSLPLKGDEGE